MKCKYYLNYLIVCLITSVALCVNPNVYAGNFEQPLNNLMLKLLWTEILLNKYWQALWNRRSACSVHNTRQRAKNNLVHISIQRKKLYATRSILPLLKMKLITNQYVLNYLHAIVLYQHTQPSAVNYCSA